MAEAFSYFAGQQNAANVYTGNTAPTDPSRYPLWLDSEGHLHVWNGSSYNDVTGSTASGTAVVSGGGSSVYFGATQPTTATSGEFWYNNGSLSLSDGSTWYTVAAGTTTATLSTTSPSGSSDPQLESMIVNDTVNLIKTNVAVAKQNGTSRYTWQNFVIDGYNNESGINTTLTSSGVAVSSGTLGFGSVKRSLNNMTSDAGAGGQVPIFDSERTADSNYAWYAFDGSTTNGDSWYTSTTAPASGHYIGLDFGASGATVINQLVLWNADQSGSQMVTENFQFVGSNDENTWAVIGSGTMAAGSKASQTFNFTNFTSYRYYRINVLTSYVDSLNPTSYAGFVEIQMWGPPTTNATVVTTANTSSAQPTSIILDSEYTGTVTYDVSIDNGVNWVTDIATDSLVDLTSVSGTDIVVRMNLARGANVQSLGYAWFTDGAPLQNQTGTILGGAATVDQLAEVQQELNMTQLQVMHAANMAAYGTPNGWFDDYVDQSGIDSTLSNGFTFKSGEVTPSGSGTVYTIVYDTPYVPSGVVVNSIYSSGTNGALSFYVTRSGHNSTTSGVQWLLVTLGQYTDLSTLPIGSGMQLQYTISGTAQVNGVAMSWV